MTKMANANLIVVLFLMTTFGLYANNDQKNSYSISWSEFAVIPPSASEDIQPGLAGPFTGISNGALIIAGGANFPDGPAWEGGRKKYHRDIYILEKKAKDDYEWFDRKAFHLPKAIAYGLTVETEEGLICIGGNDEKGSFSDVFFLNWDQEKQEIIIKELSPLPVPASNLSGGIINNQIYVAAIDPESFEKYFWSLDRGTESSSWKELPVWPGEPRTHAYGVVQNNGEADCFYLMKGRIRRSNGISDLLNDAFMYNPSTNVWTEVSTNNSKKDKLSFALAAGTSLAIGANHILIFGGDDGEIFNQLEQIGVDIAEAKDPNTSSRLIQIRDSIQSMHHGFSKDIWSYHTITDSWTKLGVLPFTSQVTTTAINWDNRIIIPTGEISPCIRTPQINALSIEKSTSFGYLNYIVLAIYLLVMIVMGLLLSRRQKSTEDFFKGGNRIPWWAAGLSIFGTQLSAITFMAIPAKTFATDWLYFFLLMTIIMVAPFIIKFYLPFYRRFNLTTAYEYLELRFNLLVRLLGSSMYVFLQIGRLGIVLLLPSLALSVVSGIDVYLCIAAMGILSIFYTVLGGIEAVIWTDVLQVIVLLGGALVCLGLLYFNLDSSDISTYIKEYDKARIFDFELSYSNPTFWVVIIGGLASNIVQYGSDQTVIQRYLTTKDEKSAAKGIRISAWLTLPSALIFFSLGTLLFVYYKVNPLELNPTLENVDAIFPWYIVNSLPDGFSGLLIAAIFAASMSSLDSSMNSVSTVITTDFYRRFHTEKGEGKYLTIARIITVIIGILGTSLALMMAGWGISSLWDQFNMIVGLFAGGLGGVFILGIFTRKSNSLGALIGLLMSGVIQYLIKEYTDIHLLLYAFTGMSTAFVIGYMTSMVIGKSVKEKESYTFKALKQI